eukprot:m.52665 g.52665  ORF g.52665 m.52665 type:complete len:563 (+) comp9118_c0_seq2:68-1756(+)
MERPRLALSILHPDDGGGQVQLQFHLCRPALCIVRRDRGWGVPPASPTGRRLLAFLLLPQFLFLLLVSLRGAFRVLRLALGCVWHFGRLALLSRLPTPLCLGVLSNLLEVGRGVEREVAHGFGERRNEQSIVVVVVRTEALGERRGQQRVLEAGRGVCVRRGLPNVRRRRDSGHNGLDRGVGVTSTLRKGEPGFGEVLAPCRPHHKALVLRGGGLRRLGLARCRLLRPRSRGTVVRGRRRPCGENLGHLLVGFGVGVDGVEVDAVVVGDVDHLGAGVPRVDQVGRFGVDLVDPDRDLLGPADCHHFRLPRPLPVLPHRLDVLLKRLVLVLHKRPEHVGVGRNVIAGQLSEGFIINVELLSHGAEKTIAVGRADLEAEALAVELLLERGVVLVALVSSPTFPSAFPSGRPIPAIAHSSNRLLVSFSEVLVPPFLRPFAHGRGGSGSGLGPGLPRSVPSRSQWHKLASLECTINADDARRGEGGCNRCPGRPAAVQGAQITRAEPGRPRTAREPCGVALARRGIPGESCKERVLPKLGGPVSKIMGIWGLSGVPQACWTGRSIG